MLDIKMINKSIMEVEEVVHTFKDTIRRYFYYDIINWTSLTNSRASKQTDNFKFHNNMSQEDIDWCKKHYLPKLKEFNV